MSRKRTREVAIGGANPNWIDVYITHTKQFKWLISAIKELLIDGIMDFRPDGFNVEGIDAAHIALVHAFLTRKFFRPPFHVKQSCSLSVNFPALEKILNVAHDTDVIRIWTAVANPDELNIQLISPSRTSNWKLKLLDMDQERLSIPRESYGWNVRMHTAEYQRLIKELKIIAEDNMNVTLAPTEFSFGVEGNMSSGVVHCQNDELMMEEQEEDPDESESKAMLAANEDVAMTRSQIKYDPLWAFDGGQNIVETLKISFSMRYMELLSKTRALTKYADFRFRGDQPMLLEHDLDYICFLKGSSDEKNEDDEDNAQFGYAEEENNVLNDDDVEEHNRHCFLRYYLAPKCDEDSNAPSSSEAAQVAAEPGAYN